MWYGEIADLYDALVRYEGDIPFFLEQCRRAGGPVLELMAGTGRVSIPLARQGIDLTCVDSSPEMLERLRAKLAAGGLKAKVMEADVRTMDLEERFDLAILPFNSFSELVPEEDRRSALERIHSALRPHGRFICTLHNPPVRLRRIEAGGEQMRFPHPSGRGEVTFRLDCTYDPDASAVDGKERFEVRSPSGELAEQRVVKIRFCLPGEAWFRGAAAAAGFSVESLCGDYDGSPYREEESPFMIWTLTRTRSFVASPCS